MKLLFILLSVGELDAGDPTVTSARHTTRQYDLIERMYVWQYDLECNILPTSFTYFSNHVAYNACAQGVPNRRPLPTPRGKRHVCFYLPPLLASSPGPLRRKEGLVHTVYACARLLVKYP